jgi:hypothetical protein
MDLDLSKESDQDQDQRLLEQKKEDGPGGAEDVLDNSAGLDMESGIREFRVLDLVGPGQQGPHRSYA